MIKPRAKHIVWRANVFAHDTHALAMLRLVQALASYEHHVSVVFYGKGLSLLSSEAPEEVRGMILSFPLYDIKSFIVAPSLNEIPKDMAKLATCILPEDWQRFLADVANLAPRAYEMLLPALPGTDETIDGLL